ncbi:WD40/YVTN/BNR-like repeat-containing protein [Actinophytocola xinjiangensis]|uniref:WD40/YVTN/BNR-like repeat-containing protein n=1 Tax=Actinophytocola xinjiangensis TaxID=485602 RepID=UPI000B096CAD|nr:hypothetical protein [Actinophytocola xinjiangensis]
MRRVLTVLVSALLLAGGLPAGQAGGHPHGNWGSAYRSVDGGRIWFDLNRRHPVGTVFDVSAPSPPRVWEATDRGLLRSEDLGNTWTRVGPAAIGERVRVVSEDPAGGSVLAGGSGGLFRAPADLSRWDRVLPAEPLALTRDGDTVLVRAERGWHHSLDGGATFADGDHGLAPVAEVAGHPVVASVRHGDLEVACTGDGAYARTGGGAYAVVPGTEGLAVLVALSTSDGVLLGTSRGLLRYRPGTADPLVPEEDIPPFLAIGAMEVPARRPEELFIATSITPYPVPGALPDPVAAPESGGVAGVLWIGGIGALVLFAGVAGALARRRRGGRR